MGKSLKKLLIEITLFISMVALVGHVTVNFWERYVVQDKLADIRSSLDHLKVKEPFIPRRKLRMLKRFKCEKWAIFNAYKNSHSPRGLNPHFPAIAIPSRSDSKSSICYKVS